MTILHESDWKPVEANLTEFFLKYYFQPLFDILKKPIYNSFCNSNSEVLKAIRSGKIRYSQGTFSGEFNAKISKELSKYSTFDRPSKTWKGIPPAEVSAAAVVANDKMIRVSREMLSQISVMSDIVRKEIEKFQPQIARTINRISDRIESDVRNITVLPEITLGLREKLYRDYTHNMRLNIVNEFSEGPRKGNWNEEQVSRLREMVERNILRGSNRKELESAIMAEFDTSRRKARFLARQETHILMADLRDSRYSDAGIEIYQWINSKDIRVVGNPAGKYPRPTEGHGNHWFMGGKFCKLSDPTVYADTLEDAKAGNWKSKLAVGAGSEHPGKEYLCRCRMKPVIV
jgi:hypothetical protein